MPQTKGSTGENVAEFRAPILVDDDRHQSSVDFKPNNLRNITHIFEDTLDHILNIQETHKYKEVEDFIDKLHIFDKDVMLPEEIITYGSLVQQDMGEYLNIVN